ncbi:MAG: cell wall-binding repeat-containing protein [Anaerococcus obesiensis]
MIINGVKDADALSVSSLATKENAPVFMVESNNIRPSIKKNKRYECRRTGLLRNWLYIK